MILPARKGMHMRYHVMKRAIAVLLVLAAVIALVFLGGRYGWKLFGFSVCESAGMESVEVTDGQVRIKGFCPGLSPRGFLGYHVVKGPAAANGRFLHET